MFRPLLFLLFITAPSQQSWQLSSDKDGIRIYTAPTIADSKLKPIKVECTFNATPSQLAAVLMDIKSYPEWVYHTKSAEVIKKVNADELYYYSEVNIPWPAQNRDFVSHITVNQNPETHAITVEAPNVTGMVPSKQGIFRLTASKAKWIITPVNNNQSHVVYEVLIDASGSTPGWLVNMFVTEGPLQTFKNLRVQVQKPAYRVK